MHELVDKRNREKSEFPGDFRVKIPLQWELIVMEAGKLTKINKLDLLQGQLCVFFITFTFILSYFSLTIVNNRYAW